MARTRESLADQLYREQMGAAAYERQKALNAEARACTCGLENAVAGKFHAPGCGAIPVPSYRSRTGMADRT